MSGRGLTGLNSKPFIGRGNAVWDGTDAVMLSGEVRVRDGWEARCYSLKLYACFESSGAFLRSISWRGLSASFQPSAESDFNPGRQQAANTPWKLPLDIEDASLYDSIFHDLLCSVASGLLGTPRQPLKRTRTKAFQAQGLLHIPSAYEVMAEASAAREAESVAQ